jgi:hypothetical protein
MRSLAVVTLLTLLPLVAYADGPRPEAPRPRTETWYEFTFYGNKVGYLHAIDEPTTLDGQPAIHSKRRSVLEVRRASQTIRMESDTDAWSDPSGRPLRFTHVRTEGGAVRRLEGNKRGESFVVKVDVGGTLTEKVHPYTADLRLSASLDAHLKRDLVVGKKSQGLALLEEEGEVRPYTMKVLQKEGELFVVQSEVAGIVSLERVRASGQTVRTVVERMGAEFVEAPREQALGTVKPTDIFTSAQIPAGVRLPRSERLDELVLRLSGKSGRPPKPIEGERQKITSRLKAGVEVRISVEKAPASPPKLGAPVKDARAKAALGATPYEAITDERVVQAAKEAVGDARDAWTAARRINAFVYEHIDNKSLGQAFSTALEALASKEGDCTEHAVLFSALAKAVGIPTRLITGLVYVARKDDGVFGYHEWVEVWMGDRWYAMDPTFGQDLADVTHVKFSQGQSDPNGLREAGIVAAELFGDLQLSVVEYTEVGGKKTRP